MADDNPKRYVLGFLFTRDKSGVLLIRKKKPPWQAGLWNGIGGKVETNEHDDDAMRRECLEETGLPVWTWRLVGNMLCGNHSTVRIYTATLPNEWTLKRTTSDAEGQVMLRSPSLSHDTIPNLRWLLPLCMDEHVKYVSIDEHDRTEATDART